MAPEAHVPEDSLLNVISDQLCGMCKGSCCAAGGNVAYLTVETIRQFKQQNPDLSAEEILQAYMSRVPVESVTSACINQTSTGCALPREMRSDTCNEYFCDTLKGWREREQERESVLAIQRDTPLWIRSGSGQRNDIHQVALIDRSGSSPLPVCDNESAADSNSDEDDES